MDNEKQKKMLKMMYCLKLLKENNLDPVKNHVEYINDSHDIFINKANNKSKNKSKNKSIGNQHIPINIIRNNNGYVVNATDDDYEINQTSQNKKIKKKKKK